METIEIYDLALHCKTRDQVRVASFTDVTLKHLARVDLKRSTLKAHWFWLYFELLRRATRGLTRKSRYEVNIGGKLYIGPIELTLFKL